MSHSLDRFSPGSPILSLRKPEPRTDKLAAARSEALRVKAELERMKAEAAASRQTAEALRSALEKSTRRGAKWWLRCGALLMMSVALIKLIFFSVGNDQHFSLTSSAHSATPQIAGISLVPDNASSTNTLFVKSLDRLRDSFRAFPDRDQMDIVRQVNQNRSNGSLPCPLIWHDGVPALYIGDGGGAHPSAVAALNQCASEIEQLKATETTDR